MLNYGVERRVEGAQQREREAALRKMQFNQWQQVADGDADEV